MLEFKANTKEILPYDRRQYISGSKWNGISFQLGYRAGEIGLPEFTSIYQPLFENTVLKLDIGLPWIVNHDDKDLKWFPSDEDNLTDLRNLFRQNNIANSFKGALIFMKNDLLKVSKDILSYPFAVFNKQGLLYKDLAVSHSKLQFVIKISGHLNIDFLSTNKEMLKELIHYNSAKNFVLKEYRGTSL